MSNTLQVESAVKERYSEAAQTRVEALCCPVQYNAEYLKVIPPAILERDYGCGDPSQYLRKGETVLDLGSGAGKICFIAAQVVGAAGKVIGVDMNDDMLALARGHQEQIGATIGWQNTEFRKGRIQDLALDIDRFDAALQAAPLNGAAGFLAAEALAEKLRQEHPLIANESIDVVVSNCVLNLVEPRAKRQLFGEIFRVLRNGGRAVISDIVSGAPVPAEMQNDPELWSGCISGALLEEEFVQAFVDVGFHGVRILKRDATPWRTVGGIEFRACTVEAFKNGRADGESKGQAVLYKGPFREVVDDDGQRYQRGVRQPVGNGTAALLQQEPYSEHFELASAPSPESSRLPRPTFDPSKMQFASLKLTPVATANSTKENGCCGESTSCCS